MTANRVISKSLAGRQDILFGNGPVTQTRAGGSYTIDKVSMVWACTSHAELLSLDISQFTQATVNYQGAVTNWGWTGTNWYCKDTDITLVGSFETGFTYTAANQVGCTTFGIYSWTGALPKTVASGTDPTVVAGYVPLADVTPSAGITPSASEVLRRSYADAGLTAKGYTKDGAILTSSSDVIIHNISGKGYSWNGVYPPGGYIVPPETDPTLKVNFIDRSGDLASSSVTAYIRESVSAAETNVASILRSMKFNLSEFTAGASTISAAISNMLNAANGAGCFIGAGVYNLESAITHTGTVKLLLDDAAVIRFNGTWLTVIDGDNSVVSGGVLDTPTPAYMVNRWSTSYDLVPEAQWEYGYNLSQGYQVSGNDPEYADWAVNHAGWLTYAATGVKFLRCDNSVMSFIRGKFVTLEFKDCEFSGALQNNLHGGKDVFGTIAFKVASKSYQRGNYAMQNIVRNCTHNGICWEGQLGFKCFQNQSMMNGESNFKRMQNRPNIPTYINVGCQVYDNDSHAAYYDGFDMFVNFPPTGNTTNKRYFVCGNRSSGSRNTNYAVEGVVDFFDNYGLDCNAYGVWAPYVSASRFRGINLQNCNNSTIAGYAAMFVSGSNNKLEDITIVDDAPVNYALHIRGTNSTYKNVLFGSSFTNPLRVVGTGITGIGNRGTKSANGVSLDNYLLTDFEAMDDDATAVGLGFLVRSSSNKRVGKIVTNLTVPSADNMYSEMLFTIRSAGNEAAALTLVSPDAVGHTYAMLNMNIDGTHVIRRVKVGAPGTGPAGVGRMLYVDP